MRTLSTCAAVSLFIVVGACAKKQDDTQPAAAPTAAGGYPGYPPQPGAPPPGYGPQQPQPAPGYAQQPQPAPAPMPGPAPGAPTATAAMAVPGPVAFQCQNDVPCGTHHCNTQYGKCAFPCQTNTDCIAPNSCMMGLCVPQMPQAH
jgi:hypothetical protein